MAVEHCGIDLRDGAHISIAAGFGTQRGSRALSIDAHFVCCGFANMSVRLDSFRSYDVRCSVH
jgi:hypothetical protein